VLFRRGRPRLWCGGGVVNAPGPKMCNNKFPGYMPVIFCRHNIEEAQRGDDKEGG